MALDRRGFLGRLFAGLGAMAAAPAIDLFQSPVEAVSIIGDVPTYTATFERLVYEAFGEFQRRLPFPSYHLTDAGLIGQGPLRHQFAIELMPSEHINTRPDFMQRQIVPAMASLAERAKAMSAFGVLALPTHVDAALVVTDKRHGTSMRGMQAYRFGEDMSVLRFDVVCG